MRSRSLAMPWAPSAGAYCLPGSIVLKMALGEAPEKIPSSADVRSGRLSAADGMDGGPVDRIVRHFTGGMRVSRVHASAGSLAKPGSRHLGFDDSEHVFGLARTFRIDTPPGAPLGPLVDSLMQVAAVEMAAPNYVCITPFAASSAADTDSEWTPWNTIRAVEALAYEPGDPAVIVAVIDSGVSPDHPELSGRLRAGFDTVQIGRSDFAMGLEFLGDSSVVDTDPTDRFVGHGMGCSGIIAALGRGMPPGIAGDARILPMRALGAARFPGKPKAVGLGSVTDLDMAMKMAVDLGAKVINMSFGTDDASLEPGAPKPHADTVAYALDRGCILVAASGNNGETGKYWPCAHQGVIAVGSVGADGMPSSFSTRGDHVALCAPGERIYTLGLEDYQYATGTSFAAPFVSAAAALLVARSERRSSPLDGATARSLLTATATPFADRRETGGCGSGVLNVHAALRALDDFIDRSLPDEPGDDSGAVEKNHYPSP